MPRLGSLVLLLAVLACSHTQEQRPEPAYLPQSPADAFEQYLMLRQRPHIAVEIPRNEQIIRPLPWVKCIDDALNARELNRYGDPQGTKYPGGLSPDLTDIIAEYREIERERNDVGPLDDDFRAFLAQYTYVLRRQPDLAKTCFPDDVAAE